MKTRIMSLVASLLLIVVLLTCSATATVEHGWCANCMKKSATGDYSGYVYSYCVKPQTTVKENHRHPITSCQKTSVYRTTYLKCNKCGISRTVTSKHLCYVKHTVLGGTTSYYCICDK